MIGPIISPTGEQGRPEPTGGHRHGFRRAGCHDDPGRGDGRSSSGRIRPPTPAELAARFPHLEVIELLGHGGMGVVYKGRQTFLDRLVAIKVLRPDLQADGAFQERFLREAPTLAKLRHPYIVTVFDVLEAQGLYGLVMEYVEGTSLRQRLEEGSITERGPRLRAADDRGAPARPRGRGRSPGHQARERPGGFASGGCGSWISAWPRSSAPRCRRAPRRRPGGGHVPLHGSRTDLDAPGGGPPRRHLLHGRRLLRDAYARIPRARPRAALAEGGHRPAPRPHRPPRLERERDRRYQEARRCIST